MYNYFSEYGLPCKIVLIKHKLLSEKFQDFCTCLIIHHAVSSSYIHQSNGWVEACLKFIKRMRKKSMKLFNDICKVLLQIRSVLNSPGLTSPAMLHFNKPAKKAYCQNSTDHLYHMLIMKISILTL